MKKLLVLLFVLALAAFAFSACGGDDEESETSATTEETTTEADAGGGEAVAVSAAPDGSFAFEETELSAPAGGVTFEFTNEASLPHDLCIEGGSADVGCTDLIADGETATLEADLEAGDYTFYCDVAGHREGGMEGPLTVE